MTDKASANRERCIVCDANDAVRFLALKQVPVHCNILWRMRSDALQAPRGDIHLAICRHCGHVFNAAFDPALMAYNVDYENSLHYSPRFQRYAMRLARRLVSRYDLHHKRILEIGCGQGDFLRLLAELGGNECIGFDPGYRPQEGANDSNGHVEIVQDYFSEQYSGYDVDLVCCRQVLEHLERPTEFIAMIRRATGSSAETALFFEVPNALYTFRDLSVWDIIYEHVSLFGATSLSRACELGGCDVCDVSEAFDGQFLWIDSRSPSRGISGSVMAHNLEPVAPHIATFADRYQAKVEQWRIGLEQMRESGLRTVVWGAGSKGVMFLNTLNTRDHITYVVDINPRKQGMYVPGTGQMIVAPRALASYRPDVVIVMNAAYETEIRKAIADIGLSSTLMLA